MKKLVSKVVNMYDEPSRKFFVLSVSMLVLMIVVTVIVVYFTGGTKYSYPHLAYVPILLGSFLFLEKGGLIIGLILGISLGPLMPLDVKAGVSQSVDAHMLRTVFFVIIGLFSGYMSRLLRDQINIVRNNLDDISLIYGNTLKSYARLVSERDEQTAYHCERVAYNSQLLGKKIGLDNYMIEILYWTGLLHDVGKIGVREEILLKPGRLTKDEFSEMAEHTTIGYEIVASLSEDFKIIAEGVRSHHEKWDGSGYPDRLKGEEIPITGRILAIVDVFEALTSERPYKSAWSPKEAINYIVENKAILFDPNLVDSFVELHAEGALWISNEPIRLNDDLKPQKFNKELLNNKDLATLVS